MVRTSRIDTNDIIDFKDGKMRVKAVAITNRKAPSKVEVVLRKELRSKISELKKMTVEEFVKSLILGEIQQNIRKDINKIYPIRFLEFRKTEVLD